MEPRIESIKQKKLIGMSLSMSFAEDRTPELWGGFMKRRGEIKNRTSADLISMQIFPASFRFSPFTPDVVFTKWAVAEVTDFSNVPHAMSAITMQGGLYAVFLHKGPASSGPATFGFIFGTWLPASIYALDDREHFELLGANYKNNEPDSEEEIWIPIRPK